MENRIVLLKSEVFGFTPHVAKSEQYHFYVDKNNFFHSLKVLIKCWVTRNVEDPKET